MKFELPDWPAILKDKLKKSGMRQNELAAKLKMLPQSVHAMLLRPKHKHQSIMNMSWAFNEDLMVHYLAKETKVILNKALEAGVASGEKNELLAWKAEMEQMASVIGQQEADLVQKAEELKKLNEANQELKKVLGGVQKEYDGLASAKLKEQEGKDQEILQLKDEFHSLEIASNLRIAVLEAKLEVLQGK